MATRARAVGNGFHAESVALKQAFSYLVNSIDTAALLPVSMSRKLITEWQKSECAGQLDHYKKAEVFLGHLQRAVNGDCGKFHAFVQILHETDQDNIARQLHDELTTISMQLTTTAEGDVKKGNASADHCGTDKLTKCAKNEGFDPEMSAQFDELKIQIKGTRAEIQPPIKTHDEKSNDSAATTATSGKAAAGWHYAEFCSFKQQTQEKFEEKAQEIHDLEQLIRNSDKNQQDQTKVLASKTLEVLKELKETQAEISRSVTKIDENSSGMKEAIEQLRTKQERHGQILEELKRMNDEKAIKNQLEKIQQGCQVSQEAHLTRLEPIQVQMIITQLKEALQNMHS